MGLTSSMWVFSKQNSTSRSSYHPSVLERRLLIYGNERTLAVCSSAVQRTFGYLTNLRVPLSKWCTFNSLPWSLRKWFLNKKKFCFFQLSRFKCAGSSKTSTGMKVLCFLVSLVGLVKTTLFSWGCFIVWASDLVNIALKTIVIRACAVACVSRVSLSWE